MYRQPTAALAVARLQNLAQPAVVPRSALRPLARLAVSASARLARTLQNIAGTLRGAA